MKELQMDKKTRLTSFVPELMEDWNKYKKGLKGLKITDWCISSDYCFDDPNKLDVATFTIFPAGYMDKIYQEINDNLPRDIKHKRRFTETELNYLKDSKYFFSISIILYNLKNYLNKEKATEQVEKMLKITTENLPFPTSDIDFHKNKEKLHEYLNNLKKHNCPVNKLAQTHFVAQFVAQLMEFILIKENSKIIGWCPDKGEDSFNNGMVYNLVQCYIHRLIKNRIKNFRLACPPPPHLDKHLYMRDAFIRIPDIITGALSSLVPMKDGLTAQKTKHCEVINKCLVNNHKMIHLIYDFGKSDQPTATRFYFESIDKYPSAVYNQISSL